MKGVLLGDAFGGGVKDQARPQRDVRPCTNSVVRTIATPNAQSFAVSPLRVTLRPTIVVYQLLPNSHRKSTIIHLIF